MREGCHLAGGAQGVADILAQILYSVAERLMRRSGDDRQWSRDHKGRRRPDRGGGAGRDLADAISEVLAILLDRLAIDQALTDQANDLGARREFRVPEIVIRLQLGEVEHLDAFARQQLAIGLGVGVDGADTRDISQKCREAASARSS